MKKKFRTRALSILVSAAMALSSIPVYAAPSITVPNDQDPEQISDLPDDEFKVFTPDNATWNEDAGRGNDSGVFRIINDRFISVDEDGLIYKEIGPEKAQVIGVEEGVKYIVIPETVERKHDDGSIETYTEISIAADAFMNNDYIESVTILPQINEIPEEMFYSCDRLKTVILASDKADANISIGDCAFGECYALTSVTIPHAISSLGEGAFSECDSLESVEFTMTGEIGEGAFSECDNLVSVKLTMNEANPITKIPADLFFNCSSLKNFIIPDSVEEIGDSAFWGCESLETLNLGSNLKKIGEFAFGNCFGMQDNRLQIPSSVISIGCGAFELEYFEDYVSYYYGIPCNAIDEGVAELIAKSFYYDDVRNDNYDITLNGVQYFYEPDGVTESYDGDFLHNEMIFEKIDNHTAKLTNYASSGPAALLDNSTRESVYNFWIPGEVYTYKPIGGEECRVIINEGGNGNYVISTENGQNLYIDSKLDVYSSSDAAANEENKIGDLIPYTVVEIGDRAFKNAYFYQGNVLVVPETVVKIGEEAFYGLEASYDRSTIILPTTLKEIGDRAFADMVGFNEITVCEVNFADKTYTPELEEETLNIPFGEGLRIGDQAFANIHNNSSICLETVALMTRIDEIGEGIFENQYDLDGVVFLYGNMDIEDYTFYGCRSLSHVVVPIEFDEEYNLTGKTTASKIGAYAFSECYNIQWIQPSFGDAAYNSNTNLVIPPGITSIGEGAFMYCANLESVSFSETIESIPSYAFYNCQNLKYVYCIEQDESSENSESNVMLKTIGDRAFAYCLKLTNIAGIETVESIGEYAFDNCSQLSIMDLGEFQSLKYIREGAFYKNEGFEVLNIPASVVSIGANAFEDCINISEINFGVGKDDKSSKSSLEEIGDCAFGYCGKVEELSFPDGVKKIGRWAFDGCDGLTKVTIGSGIEWIGTEAFPANVEFQTNSTKSQLVLVEYLNCVTIPEVEWDGRPDAEGEYAIEPGAIVTLDAGEMNGKLGRNTQVFVEQEAEITQELVLEKGAMIEVRNGAVLEIGSDAKLTVKKEAGIIIEKGSSVVINQGATLTIEDGAEITRKAEPRAAAGEGEAKLVIWGTVNGGGKISSDIAIYKELTDDMVQSIDPEEFTGYAIKTVPTVEFTVGSNTQSYSAGDGNDSGDFVCTYKNNTKVGVATVTIKAAQSGKLLGSNTITRTFNIEKTDEATVSPSVEIDGSNVKVDVTITKRGPVNGGRDSVKITAIEQLTEEQRANGKTPNTLVKTITLNSGESETATASAEWKGVYNGTYSLTIEYSGDSNHSPKVYPESTPETFVVTGYTRPSYNGSVNNGGGSSDNQEGSSGSTGSGSNGGGGSGSGSNGGGAVVDSIVKVNDNVKPDYGVLAQDPVKGLVGSKYGIITANHDDQRSHWVLDEISALIWGGSSENYWKLQYRDGSYAEGSKAVDENGKVYENYHWELINKRWWAFDSNGFAKLGWIYDENYKGWFYIHIKHGMQTGWICVGGKWYYMNPDTEGCEGMMYAAQWTPDGYYVNEDGAWDGRPAMQMAQ